MRKRSNRFKYFIASSLLFGVVNLTDLFFPFPTAQAEKPENYSHKAKPTVSFPAHQGCVAWNTHETMFFMMKKEAVGMNCHVSSILQPVKPGLYRFEMLVPIAGFESGSKARDREVQRILKAKVQPNLFFATEPRPLAEWHKFLAQGETQIDGFLSIAGNSYPVRTTIHVTQDVRDRMVYGEVKTNFRELGIEPPKVFGGAFTKVSPELSLAYQIPTRETQNFRLVAHTH